MSSRTDFPKGTYYALTWQLGVDQRGMTNALLRRSRDFVAAGCPVTILTYEVYDDLSATVAELRSRGDLVDGISVRNLWDDLGSWTDDELATNISSPHGAPTSSLTPIAGPDDEARSSRVRETLDSEGTLLQRDTLRVDGSLLCMYRPESPSQPEPELTLCDSHGQPIHSWVGAREFYRSWLDTLPRDERAFLLVDSKGVANHVTALRRDDIYTIYIVHGSHLADGVTSPHGELSARRRRTFERLHQFDGVVFLTESQRDDVSVRLPELTNLYVCPNATEQQLRHRGRNLDDRPVKRGVGLGALVRGKRWSHAIKAVGRARRERCNLKLDIFGVGGRRDRLTKTIRRLKLRRHVRLRGYSSDPLAELANASFLLMTSIREGFGLVLIEAMSQGCLPIAYDVKYGPSDIITHGVDGFLVPDGDVKALAAAMTELVRMPSGQRLAMREAAVRRAAQFSGEHVTQKWCDIVTAVSQSRQGAGGTE